MRNRPALVLALTASLAGSVALGSAASAERAPKTSPTSSTFYLAQDGCGAEAGAGRLEVKAVTSSATGCGTIGGLPIDEVIYQAEGPAYDVYSTVGKGLPIVLDASKKVTGQIAAGDWIGVTGGFGAVDVDVALLGVTVDGRTIDFGTATGSTTAQASATSEVPFELAVPAAANGAALKSLELSVSVHGANVGMSSKQLDGDSYLVVPTKAAKRK